MSRTRPSLYLRDGPGGGVVPGMGLGRSNKYGVGAGVGAEAREEFWETKPLGGVPCSPGPGIRALRSPGAGQAARGPGIELAQRRIPLLVQAPLCKAGTEPSLRSMGVTIKRIITAPLN